MVAPLADKQKKWLDELVNVYGVQTKWKANNEEKSKRVEKLDKKIQSSKDELRMLFDFEVTVKRKGVKSLFSETKQVKVARGTEKSWNPDKEFDLGYYMERIDGGELSPDAKEKISRAYALVDEWERELLAPSGVTPIPNAEWDQLRNRLQLVKETAEQEHKIAELEKMLEDTTLGSDKYKKLELDLKNAKTAIAKALNKAKLDIIQEYSVRTPDPIVITEQDIDAITEPMMDRLELRRELWDRLVRERIFPANMVPEDYNETTQQFQGANKLYEERMRSTFDPEKEREAKLQKFNKGLKDLKAISGNVASCIPGEEPKLAKQISDLVFDVLTAGVDVYAALSKKDFDGTIKAISNAAASAISRSVFFGADPNVATAVGTGINYGLSLALAGKKAFATSPPDWEGIIIDVAAAVENGFGCVAAGAGIDGNSDQSVLLRELGRGLNTGIVIACKGIVAGRAVYKEDPVVVMQSLAKIVDQVIYNGLTSAADFVPQTYRFNVNETPTQPAGVQEKDQTSDENTTSEQLTKIAVEQNRIKDLVAEAGEGAKFEEIWEKQREKLTTLKPEPIKLSKNVEDTIKKQLEERAARDEDKAMEAELQDWRQQLMFLSGGEQNSAKALQSQFDANSIDKLIAQIELDRLKLKMAETLFDSVVGLTAQFVEPVMMASATKDLIKDATMAVRRIMEFQQWTSLHSDAINACSVQGFAFANRIKNLKLQIADRTIKCVFELGQIVGGAVAASGIGGAAGVAVSKASTAGKALWGFIKDRYAENDLRKQWNLYKESLNRPTDHRTMRAVLRGNPTLSKYAMAYAAVKENDPIAKKGLIVCGLSSEVLQNPDTNAGKVVQYLETQFNEDPKLVRSLRKAGWQKEDNSPAMKCWAANRKVAADKLQLETASVNQIDPLLLSYQQDALAFERGRTTLEILISEVDDNTEGAQAMLGDMADIRDELLEFAKTVANAELLVADSVKYGQQHQLDNEALRKKLTSLPQQVDQLMTSPLLKEAEFREEAFAGGDSEFRALQIDLEKLFAHNDCEMFTRTGAVPHAEAASSGDKLVQTLLSVKPRTTGDKNEKAGECREFADYCNAMATRVKYARSDLVAEGERLAGKLDGYRRQLESSRELLKNRGFGIDPTRLRLQLKQIGEKAKTLV